MNSAARGGTFFRTMVLMGSSVAMSCGGVTQTPDGSGGAGGSPSSGGSGGGGTGGSPSGGTTGVGGGIILGSGGQGTGGLGLGGLGGAFPTDCPTTQLSCPELNTYSCGPGEFLQMPADCACDAARPRSVDDCAAEEAFVCLGASVDAHGGALDPVVPYSCECVPEQVSGYCSSHCEQHSDSMSWATCRDPEEDLEAFLCGCALTVLK